MTTATVTKTHTRQRAHKMNDSQEACSPLPPAFASNEAYIYLRDVYMSREAVRQDLQSLENRLDDLDRRGQVGLKAAMHEVHDLNMLRWWKRNIENEMRRVVKELKPYKAFLEHQRGVDALGASILLACLGDPAQYKNPSAIWKRMGVAVVDAANQKGERVVSRQRRFKDKHLAKAHGYDSIRHAVSWNMAVRLCQYNDEYRALADERLRNREASGWGESESHRWKDARRYAFKRFLVNLWLACRDPFVAHLSYPTRP